MDSRERFITATTELFRRQGYHATSMKQITAATGLPTGSLYHFFPGGKEQLAQAAVVTSGRVYCDLLELIWDGADSPADAVQAFFEGAAAVLEETDFIDPCPIGTIAREVASTNDALRISTTAVFDLWITTAAARLRAAGLGASVATDLATTFVGTVEGGFVLARASRDADRLRATGRHMRLLVQHTIDMATASDER